MTGGAAAYAREAVAGLASNLQRSLLALVGIVVGIGSVIALMTAGNIARNEAIKQFEALGTDVVSVFQVGDGSDSQARDMLDSGDAPDLEGLATIRTASPYAFQSSQLALGGQQSLFIRRVGVTPAFAEMHRLELAKGRFISPFDGRRPFAVIGAEIAQAMREAGLAAEVGAQVRVEDAIYTIAGVLKSGSSGPPGVRIQDAVLIPLELMHRVQATKEVLGITLRLQPGVHYLAAAREIESWFQRTAPGMRVRVDSPAWLVEQMERQMRLFAILLGSVAGIALVVGGFGIMNAMLASVTERRREIGIRRAIGARQRDIQLQFLAESAVLCVLGGLLGALIGTAATVIISLVAGWTWQFSPAALALGLATASAVGLAFGYFPARQAARLDPITALRDA